jgi:hypothetical protein
MQNKIDLLVFKKCLDHGVIGYVNFYTADNTTGASTSTTNVPSIVVIDRWALVVFTILFFAYQIGTITWMYLVPWKKRRMMFKKDNENRLHILSRGNHSQATYMDV